MSHYNWPLRTPALANRAVTPLKISVGPANSVLTTPINNLPVWSTTLVLAGALSAAGDIDSISGRVIVADKIGLEWMSAGLLGVRDKAQTGYVSLAAYDITATHNLGVSGTLAVGTNGSSLASTTISGGLTISSGGLSVTQLTTFNTGSQAWTTTSAGTNASYGTFVNANGSSHFGVDNSAGSGLFGIPYATGILAPGQIVFRTAGTNALAMAPGGLVQIPNALWIGTGSVSTSGELRLANQGQITWRGSGGENTAGVLSIDSVNSMYISAPYGEIFLSCITGGTSVERLRCTNQNSVLVNGHFAPYVTKDTQFVCGNFNARWSTVYAVNGTIQTSAAASKEGWAPIDPAAALAAVRGATVGTFRYVKPEGRTPEDDAIDPAYDWQRVGIIADDAHDWLSPDKRSVSPQDTACLALAAIQALAERVEALEAR